MKTSKSILKFNGYVVEYIEFKLNDSYIDDDSHMINLSPEFKRQILKSKSNNKEFIVKLSFNIDDNNKKNTPFTLKTKICGFFELSNDSIDNKFLIKENALAILFPYLRSLITNITTNANISPLILPTINIADMLSEEEVQKDTTN